LQEAQKQQLKELAELVKEYLLVQKRISQIESWLEAVGKDGRVHGKVITNGAVTGRMTHSSPNMAQIPNAGSVYGKECRECWTVEGGNVLVGCDASGLELRMLAHYMKDGEYVKTVTEGSSKDGTDVHTQNQKAAGLQFTMRSLHIQSSSERRSRVCKENAV
jgi:DNA polymerase I-like protein with 3'-5' exonuclease and polymerase domains